MCNMPETQRDRWNEPMLAALCLQEVRPDVFLKVLTGDADGVKQILGREGKVLKR